MGTAGTYFRHIKEAVVTIFDGMAVTASHFIRKPYTIQYPDRIPVRVQDTLPFRYRGILDVDLEICTGCLACDRACPIDCIAMAIEKNAQTREILISQFDIDLAKCMYCGLCSEPCPTGAIHHTTEFEGSDYSLESLIRRFVVEPTVAYKPKKGPEPDPDLAKLLDRGMKYVDEWAQPGSDKPGPTAAAAAPSAKPAAPKPTPADAPKPAPAAAAVRPVLVVAPRLGAPAGATGSSAASAAPPKPAVLRPLALKAPVAPAARASDSPTPATPATSQEPAAAVTPPASDDKGDKQG
jgi:NADH-quinone oxidoreductase subunit I/NAD(P)H-quinone oxidoreductase subunit I